jgi:hypothetical protein
VTAKGYPVNAERERFRWQPLEVATVAVMLERSDARWWLSGGRAIDHWVGRTTRAHGDIDVSTLRSNLQQLLAVLPAGLEPVAAMGGQLRPLADHVDDPALHNIWVRDHGRWLLQLNVEDGDERCWRYRRDPRITLPWDRAVAVVRTVPTGTPATQLLWKSAAPRPRDDADCAAVRHTLSGDEREWLRGAIRTAHPDSPWALAIRD